MLTPNDLRQFSGTEQWFRHGLNPKMLYTEGVQHFAQNAGHGAYWFLDIVATEIMPLLKREPFIVIRMFVDVNQASIKADDGNDNVLWTRHIEYTDCPAGMWQFYLTDNVLMVPSEY